MTGGSPPLMAVTATSDNGAAMLDVGKGSGAHRAEIGAGKICVGGSGISCASLEERKVVSIFY